MTPKEWGVFTSIYFLFLNFKLEVNLLQPNLLLQFRHAVFTYVPEFYVDKIMV